MSEFTAEDARRLTGENERKVLEARERERREAEQRQRVRQMELDREMPGIERAIHRAAEEGLSWTNVSVSCPASMARAVLAERGFKVVVYQNWAGQERMLQIRW